KGEVPDVLIPWIRAVRLQLSERFRQDLRVLRLHSDRGVWYAAHQLNLWPHVSLPETSPTLRWTGKVGDASVFWVWGSRAFVRDTSADKLSARTIPCAPDSSPLGPGPSTSGPARRLFLRATAATAAAAIAATATAATAATTAAPLSCSYVLHRYGFSPRDSVQS
ncbi:unnamed protein product, partial [Closterium sp. NIES-54]